MNTTEAQVIHGLLSKGKYEAVLKYVTRELNFKADHQIYMLMEKMAQWLPFASNHMREQIVHDLDPSVKGEIVYSRQAHRAIAEALGDAVCYTYDEIRDLCFGDRPRKFSKNALDSTQMYFENRPATKDEIVEYFNNQMGA